MSEGWSPSAVKTGCGRDSSPTRGEISVRCESGEALALLPRAVGAPSLQALKARWDGALGSLSCQSMVQ